MKVFHIKIFNQKHNQVKKNVSVQKRKRDKLVCHFTVPCFILNTDTKLVLMQGILVETVKPQCAYIHSTLTHITTIQPIEAVFPTAPKRLFDINVCGE